MLGLVVPVLYNFKGLTELMASVDVPVQPFVIDNWNQNRGVAGGWNEGIRRALEAGCEAIAVSNDDVRLWPGTLQKLVRCMEDYPLVSATASEGPEEYLYPADYSLFMIRPDLVEKVGWFDEVFYPAYFEDNDMNYRLKLAGYPETRWGGARIDHVGSVTQNWNGDMVVSHSDFEKNRLYYKTKWGGVPGEETYTMPFGVQ